MASKFYTPKEFTADKAWGALPITTMNGTSIKLHWTNEAYQWHVNDGEEVFVVLDGKVEMHYKKEDKTHIKTMKTGDIFYASIGTEHVAHPKGEARILVIEKSGSV